MSVSHASPSFLHSHRNAKSRTQRKTSTGMQHQHRDNLVLAGTGLFLLGALIAGFIGMAVTIAPTPGPSSSYGADGAMYVTPPGWAVLWLTVTLLSVLAIFAYGIGTAAHYQQ